LYCEMENESSFEEQIYWSEKSWNFVSALFVL
jgi:hypothetical protein